MTWVPVTHNGWLDGIRKKNIEDREKQISDGIKNMDSYTREEKTKYSGHKKDPPNGKSCTRQERKSRSIALIPS